ncbi:sugar ABC transporter permease [Clostridium butyricum]|uniref:Sugar ABC transporter permease n=1 Tax=Clostridium butyricum TaxID=1492 RepID=A0A512TKK1_CLOBU|nr:carbohydrate ABC transporter permease [Clostridium butyricum]NOW24317.1 multiple sugar transport system permease protein [Clostridium butyricum]GEQ20538.1 sugar ABC transporter permease [Clostridium butyricum]
MNIDINNNIEELKTSELLDTDKKIYISKKTLKERIGTFSRHILLVFISIATFFPFIWMVTSALKSRQEIFTFPPNIIPANPNWHIFSDVFKEAPFATYMFNSLSVATIEVIFQIISAAMIAYALTQFKFVGRKVLFGIVMCTYMLPSAVTYVPCYIILGKLNLLDTLTGLTISNLVNVLGIFLIRQAFMQVDKSFIEAARVDGASHIKILWKIMFPLTKPTFITFGLISFVTYYNEYMYPSLITKSPEKFLISAGIRQFFIQDGAYGTKWPEIMAASTITVLPLLILFLIAQKWFMDGVGGVTVDK